MINAELDVITLIILEPRTYKKMPWRNGRGHTVELLSEPSPCSNEFVWRLSMASVSCDGPFSRFEGCDRVLVLLDGNGITLSSESGLVNKLRTPLSHAYFPGDVETSAMLHAGPIRDFNVITNRKKCVAKVDIIESGNTVELVVDGDTLLAYIVNGRARIQSPQGQIALVDKNHLLKTGDGTAGRWVFSAGSAIVIQIYRR